MNELKEFIEEVHEEPFNILSNNCIHKHIRIINKARDLGHDASLIGCISIIPIRPIAGFLLIGPHFYAEIDGKTVDVSMQPALEQAIGKNEDIVRLAPVNISNLKPMKPDEGPPFPQSLKVRWPWK